MRDSCAEHGHHNIACPHCVRARQDNRDETFAQELFEAKRKLYHALLLKDDPSTIETNIMFELSMDPTIQAHLGKQVW